MQTKGMFQYNTVVTKLRAMGSRILSPADYDKLCELKTVTRAASYIKENTNSDIIINSDGRELHREEIEKQLSGVILSEYIKIVKYLDEKDARFLRAMMNRYETEAIKSALRICGGGVGRSAELDYRFKKYSEIDAEALKSAKTYSELLKATENTPYHRVLKPLLSGDKKIRLFEAEIGLDTFYITNLYQLANEKFGGQTREFLKEIIGTQADILNILWILRCKKYYALPGDYIYSHIIPVHFKVTEEKIKEIANAENPQHLEQLLANTPSGEIVKYGRHGLHEKGMIKMLSEICGKKVGKEPYGIAAILKHLYDRELELDNICSVVEGIRYGLKKEEILEYIV